MYKYEKKNKFIAYYFLISFIFNQKIIKSMYLLQFFFIVIYKI